MTGCARADRRTGWGDAAECAGASPGGGQGDIYTVHSLGSADRGDRGMYRLGSRQPVRTRMDIGFFEGLRPVREPSGSRQVAKRAVNIG